MECIGESDLGRCIEWTVLERTALIVVGVVL